MPAISRPRPGDAAKGLKWSGRNAAKRRRQRYILYPELVDTRVPYGATHEPRGARKEWLLAALADLRLPLHSLPIRYYVAPETSRQQATKASTSSPSARSGATNAEQPAVAVPDVRVLEDALRSGGQVSRLSMISSTRTQAALATLLRALPAHPCSPHVLQAGIAHLSFLAIKSETHQYKLPRTCAVMLVPPLQALYRTQEASLSQHASALKEASDTSLPTVLRAAQRLAQQCLLPDLQKPSVLSALSAAQLAQVLRALAVLRLHHSSGEPTDIWQRVLTAYFDSHKSWTRGSSCNAAFAVSMLPELKSTAAPAGREPVPESLVTTDAVLRFTRTQAHPVGAQRASSNAGTARAWPAFRIAAASGYVDEELQGIQATAWRAIANLGCREVLQLWVAVHDTSRLEDFQVSCTGPRLADSLSSGVHAASTGPSADVADDAVQAGAQATRGKAVWGGQGAALPGDASLEQSRHEVRDVLQGWVWPQRCGRDDLSAGGGAASAEQQGAPEDEPTLESLRVGLRAALEAKLVRFMRACCYDWQRDAGMLLHTIRVAAEDAGMGRRRRMTRPVVSVALKSLLRPARMNAAGSSRRVQLQRALSSGETLAALEVLTYGHYFDASEAHVRKATMLVEHVAGELRARLESLSKYEVATSVAMLGHVLTSQALKSDATHRYLTALSQSVHAQRSNFSLQEIMLLLSGLRKLYGATCATVWCSAMGHHLAHTPPQQSGSVTRTSGFGKPFADPDVLRLFQHLGGLAATKLPSNLEAALDPAVFMLQSLGSVHLPHKQAISLLRRCASIVFHGLGDEHSGGGNASSKDLAHVLQSLACMRVPYESVYPLVRRVVRILQEAHVPSLDLMNSYLIVDALAKLRMPTPEATPLLLAIMAHISEGLDIRPTKPGLHAHINSCPPSLLLKLASAIRVLMPQTSGVLTRKLQVEPKAAFVRLLVSHVARNAYGQLTHRDLVRLLQLLKDSALGRDAPKPWTQDICLRSIALLDWRLFERKNWGAANTTIKASGGVAASSYRLQNDGSERPASPAEQPSDAGLHAEHDEHAGLAGDSSVLQFEGGGSELMFWHGQPLLDLTYLGVSAVPPDMHATSSGLGGCRTATGELHSGAAHDPDAEPWHAAGDEGPGSGRASAGADQADPAGVEYFSEGAAADEHVKWAYRKVYEVVQHADKLVLGAYKVLDWDERVLHTVATITSNLGRYSVAHGAPLLRSTPLASQVGEGEGGWSGTAAAGSPVWFEKWNPLGYHGQDTQASYTSALADPWEELLSQPSEVGPGHDSTHQHSPVGAAAQGQDAHTAQASTRQQKSSHLDASQQEIDSMIDDMEKPGGASGRSMQNADAKLQGREDTEGASLRGAGHFRHGSKDAGGGVAPEQSTAEADGGGELHTHDTAERGGEHVQQQDRVDGRVRKSRQGKRAASRRSRASFQVPIVPAAESLELRPGSTVRRAHREIRPCDVANLAVAVADFFPDSASAGRELCRSIVPSLLHVYPPAAHLPQHLARMVWALGVAHPQPDGPSPLDHDTTAALLAALERCHVHLGKMHPKHAALLLKGLRLLGQSRVPFQTQISSTPEPEAVGRQLRSMLATSGVGPEGHAIVLGVTEACTLRLIHALQQGLQQGKPLVRLEGAAEALLAASALLPDSHLALVNQLWTLLLDALQRESDLELVPLRVPNALLITSTRCTVAGPKQVSQAVNAARARLLYSRYRNSPLQVRSLVQALLWAAPRFGAAGVQDAGLVKELLRASTGWAAVEVAKRRGASGAWRLLRSVEMLAELRTYGVSYVHTGTTALDLKGGAAVVRVDEVLRQQVISLCQEVEAAFLAARSQGEMRSGPSPAASTGGNGSDAVEGSVTADHEVEDSGWGGREYGGNAPEDKFDLDAEGDGALRESRPWQARAWNDERVTRLAYAVQSLVGNY